VNATKKILYVIIAGAAGGLANSLGLWSFGALGITHSLGFNMAPAMTMEWLLPRIVISALWGLLFLLPFWEDALYRKGLLISLAPLALMLFVVFPRKLNAGVMGLKLGHTAPLFAAFFIAVWAITAAFVLYRLRRD